ncbi:MAG: transcription elongation factor GreA [Anaerolineaceae bacterium]|jgi:transcription elongation factor GreA|nr:transcription elongation factor GreA [Anaerolineaceae bacterium]
MQEVSYLTAEGARRLKEELEHLKTDAREDLARRLRIAIEQGDLSENADYTAAKEEQAFLEGRILELEATVKNAQIIDEMKVNKNVVSIGSHVTVKEDGYPEETYFMVGPKEADPVNGRISYKSPIGEALLGHKKGDVIRIETPDGDIQLTIVEIS